MALPILIGATLQHIGNGWVFSGSGGGWEFPVFWIAMLLVQTLLGDGAFAWRPALFRTSSSRKRDALSGIATR